MHRLRESHIIYIMLWCPVFYTSSRSFETTPIHIHQWNTLPGLGDAIPAPRAIFHQHWGDSGDMKGCLYSTLTLQKRFFLCLFSSVQIRLVVVFAFVSWYHFHQDDRRRDFGIVEFPFVLTPVSKADRTLFEKPRNSPVRKVEFSQYVDHGMVRSFECLQTFLVEQSIV